MNITLKNIKIADHLSEETMAFSATIYVDGKRAGHVSNTGTGGCNRYHWDKRATGDAVEAWAAKQTTDYEFEKLDQIIDDMVMRADEEKQIKRWCKNKIVFRLNGDAQGAWRTIKVPYRGKQTSDAVRARYGADKIEEIANERFA